MKKVRVCVHRCSNSSARASHESIFSRERGSIVRKADVHSEFSTKREESISPLSLSLSLPQPCRFPFYPSLSGFPAMISDVRRRRPNGNVKVTWTGGDGVCSWRSRIFLQREIDTRESISRMTHRYGKEIRIGLLNRYP